jgi:hypothetical protein
MWESKGGNHSTLYFYLYFPWFQVERQIILSWTIASIPLNLYMWMHWWMLFSFAVVVCKYLNFAICSKDLIIIFVLWFLMRGHQDVYTSTQFSLPYFWVNPQERLCNFCVFAVVLKFSTNKLTSAFSRIVEYVKLKFSPARFSWTFLMMYLKFN